MRKLVSASEYPEQQKIRSINKRRVLYIGTLSSILMLLIFCRKKKIFMRNHASVFQYECITSSIFFRPTALLCLVYICLHPNAESLYSQLLSVQWCDLRQSCFPLFWLLHHHMSSVFLVPLTLVLSLPISPVSEGNSHYIKASLQRPGWNNPLK